MRFDSPERLKANNFLVVTTGALVLGLSLWVTSLILKSVYGRYDWSDILPTKVNIERVFSNDKRKVAILHSQYTEQTAAEGSTWLADNVQAWEQFAKSHELQYEIIDDPALESGLLENYKIIVLPGTRALSDNEILILKRYLDQGGSVFATSGTGSFREDGEWRGWEFLSQVFGIQFVNEINPDEPRKIHTLRGGLPVTAGIPTGYTLKVATWDRPMECEVLESRTTQASFWYNFRSDSGLVHEELERTAGIVYGSYGKGRFVWMGFELNSVLGDKNDYVYFDRLCKQSVDWLAGKPSVVIRDWPAPYTAATITTASLSR